MPAPDTARESGSIVESGTPAKSVPVEQVKAPPEDEPEDDPEEELDEEPDDDPDGEPDDDPDDEPDEELESSPGPSFGVGELDEHPAMTHVMASAHGAIATAYGKIDVIFMKGHSSARGPIG